jgi:hypothetical protein
MYHEAVSNEFANFFLPFLPLALTIDPAGDWTRRNRPPLVRANPRSHAPVSSVRRHRRRDLHPPSLRCPALHRAHPLLRAGATAVAHLSPPLSPEAPSIPCHRRLLTMDRMGWSSTTTAKASADEAVEAVARLNIDRVLVRHEI